MIATPSAAKPDHRSLLRKKRPPSARDQAIYLAYKTTGKTQSQLAADHDLTQRRISQIIQRVERWRANLIPAASGELDRQESQRLERWLEQQRLQCIYDHAMRAHKTQATELKTTRKGNRDGKPFEDETTRQLPTNVQLLKVALRASNDLGKLSDKPAPAAPDPKNDWERYWKVIELLRGMRHNAGVSLENANDESKFVTSCLDQLIGKEAAEPQPTATNPAPRGADIPVCHQDTVDDPAPPLNSEPGTLNSPSPFSNASNASNVSLAASAPPLPAASTQTEMPQPTSAGEPSISAAAESLPKKIPAEPSQPIRRQPDYNRREAQLEQLREARRKGAACFVEFDPIDGPIPPPALQIDDFGYQPTPPPSSAEIRAQNAAWLQRLAADYPEANGLTAQTSNK